jgi:uncharacterized protein YxjI
MMNFPLDLRFKILAIAQQISVTDSAGRVVAYVKQKAFKLKEDVTVFGDEAQTRPLYRIRADRVIDFSAQYRIEDTAGAEIGTVQRQGMRSFWRAHYDVHRAGQPVLTIREHNPWVKVLDGLLTEIPIVNLFSGYFLHPAYDINRADTGATVLWASKRAAFLEGRFEIDVSGPMNEEDERLGVLSILMVLLLERTRG